MNDYLIPFFDVCRRSDVVFYKVLSQNDRSWAWPKDREGYAHQGGVVIPDNCTGIFPRREIEEGTGKYLVGDRRYFRIHTFWLGEDGEWYETYTGNDWKRQSKFGRSYKDRQEFRITGGLPRSHFDNLSPGSLLICARQSGAEFGRDYVFNCLTIDAQSEAYTEFIQAMLIPDPPWAGIMELSSFVNPLDDLQDVPTIATVSSLLGISEYRSAGIVKIWTARELSDEAVRRFEEEHGGNILELFRKSASHGDMLRLLMEGSFAIVKEQQQRSYPGRVAELIWSSLENRTLSQQALVAAIAAKAEDIRGIFKSMQNSIFALAGNCFQNYLRLWLDAFGIPYEPQEPVDGARTPDFVLPGIEFYFSKDREPDDAILLAAKTSCRERWQQILAEGRRVETHHLATLDSAIPGRTLKKMQADRVIVIVPEPHKKQLEHYRSATNVFDYSAFMKVVLIPRKQQWGKTPLK